MERVRELDRENLDLKIANRGKDFLIDQMQKGANRLSTSYSKLVEKWVNWNLSSCDWVKKCWIVCVNNRYYWLVCSSLFRGAGHVE